MTVAEFADEPIDPAALRGIFAFEVPFVVVSVLLATSAANGWPLVLMLVTGAVVLAGYRSRWFRAVTYLISCASGLIVVLAPNLSEWSLSLWTAPLVWVLTITTMTFLTPRTRI